MHFLRTLGWLACVVYSTIPLFWLMVHPRAHRWRAREGSPFRVLVPAWIVMWIGIGALTGPWRSCGLLFDAVDVASRRPPVCHRHHHLFELRSPLQLGPTRRPAGSPHRKPGPAPRHHRHPLASPPPGLSRPPLRNAGLERRHRPRRLLAADRVRDRHRRGNDSHGRRRTGEALRRRVSLLIVRESTPCCRSCAHEPIFVAVEPEGVAIIRLG